jgi:hypothetical protein
MSKFLMLEGGTTINLDHVILCRSYKNGESEFHFADGSSQRGKAHEWSAPELAIRRGTAVVPAAPGFYRLELWEDEEGVFEVERQPVIAWRILEADLYSDPSGGADPICPEDACGAWVLLLPDGQVLQLGDRAWKTEAEWREFEEKKRRAERGASS